MSNPGTTGSLATYGPPALGLLSLIGLLGFYCHAWRIGRDPPAGSIVPIFEPPDNLSPAGMRYILKMGADNRSLAAALVDMGVKGHVRLVEEKTGWTRIERLRNSTPLFPEEEAALDELCSVGGSIVLGPANYGAILAASDALKNVLKAKFDGRMFKRNYGWAVAGLFFFLAALLISVAAVAVATDAPGLWRVGVLFGCLIVGACVWSTFHEAPACKSALTVAGLVQLGIGVLLVMPILADPMTSRWWLPVILPALALPIVLSAFYWISCPTTEGREVLDRIAGFEQYLSVTERERLDRIAWFSDTPEIFEKYLPYAIALGIEDRFAQRFAGALERSEAVIQQGFAWYSGGPTVWDDPTELVDRVGKSLASRLRIRGSSGGDGGY